MVNIYDKITGIIYNNVSFDAFNGTNRTCIFYVGKSSTRYSIPMDQVVIEEEESKIESVRGCAPVPVPEEESKIKSVSDCVPVPVPASEEEENKFKKEALVLIQSINTKNEYKFVFISGERVGNFISNNKDTMFISVEGSGRVSIPLSWLREIIAV
jgi:hypothetical protein